MVRVDEIEDLLLSVGERFAHSVQVNTFFGEGNGEMKRTVIFLGQPRNTRNTRKGPPVFVYFVCFVV
jgi:hypothetical protein